MAVPVQPLLHRGELALLAKPAPARLQVTRAIIPIRADYVTHKRRRHYTRNAGRKEAPTSREKWSNIHDERINCLLHRFFIVTKHSTQKKNGVNDRFGSNHLIKRDQTN